MVQNPLPTQFAPAERTLDEKLQYQIKRFQENADFRLVADANPNILLILNQERQMVYGNRRLMESFNKVDLLFAIGLRPGELFDCIHSSETEGGCGTTEFCRTCGAVKAICTGLNGQVDVQECRINQKIAGRPWICAFTQPRCRLMAIYTLFL